MIKDCVLPNFDGTQLWPARRFLDPMLFSPPVPHSRKHSPEWGQQLDEQNAQAEAAAIEAAKQSEEEAERIQRESGAPVWWKGEQR